MVRDVSWEPPGPGIWAHDGSHSDRPPTRFRRSIDNDEVIEGLVAGFRRTGIAQGPVTRATVNGWPYAQQGPPDPATYPALEGAGDDFLTHRRWVERLATWEHEHRPERLSTARALQAVDITSLDDPALLDHLDDAIAARRASSFSHFEQHSLCVLIGLLVLATREWGIPDADVLPLLEGFSPASARTNEHLDAIAAALRDAGVVPSDLDEVRNASPAAAAALDDYLDLHGMQPVAGFDLDARSLVEMPNVIVTSIVAAMLRPRVRSDRRPETVRDRVPVEDQRRFDQLLADARSVYGLRDDDVSFLLWGSGLVRRALLEIGRRLVRVGRLDDERHVFDVEYPELRALVVGGDASSALDAPTAEVIAERFDLRKQQGRLRPPSSLGDGPPPIRPLEEMPATVRRLTMAMSAYVQLRRRGPTGTPLEGVGIGREAARGRAVVAANADDAFDRLEPGDVLVTRLTTPAFNAVLTLCGALVVEDAGVLSHAAVMARELGLAAVVGVADATVDIPDGATVEVDPLTGRVTVL